MKASDVGLTGAESFAELSADQEKIRLLASIREAVAVKLGWADTPEEAREKTPGVPKVAIAGPPRAYTATSGKEVGAEDMDIVGRSFSLDKLHRTFQASGLHCLAGTCLLTGTIPAQLCRRLSPASEHHVRIGHPDGVVTIRATRTEDGQNVASVSMDRTARRLMRGEVFAPVTS